MSVSMGKCMWDPIYQRATIGRLQAVCVWVSAAACDVAGVYCERSWSDSETRAAMEHNCMDCSKAKLHSIFWPVMAVPIAADAVFSWAHLHGLLWRKHLRSHGLATSISKQHTGFVKQKWACRSGLAIVGNLYIGTGLGDPSYCVCTTYCRHCVTQQVHGMLSIKHSARREW